MATKKRQPKHRLLADQVKERLEQLRAPHGPQDKSALSYSDFAAHAGVPRPVYNAWRNAGRVPGGYYLRLLAKTFGVTADWLLGIEGAPKYASQWRTDAALADDLAAHVLRESLPQVKPRPEPQLSDRLARLIDGELLLCHLVEVAARDLNASAEYFRKVMANADRVQRTKAFSRVFEAAGVLKPSQHSEFLNAALAVLSEVRPPQVTVISYPLVTPTPAIGPPPGKKRR